MYIQSITNSNSNKNFIKFKSTNNIANATKNGVDTFVNSTKDEVLKPITNVIIKNIDEFKNFIINNKNKFTNGNIFTTPITPAGQTLLDLLPMFKKTEQNQKAYEATIDEMQNTKDINYSYKDSLGISFVQKIVLSENIDLLFAIKDKDIEPDLTAIREIKNSNNKMFKSLFKETKMYKNYIDNFNNLIRIYSNKKYAFDKNGYSEDDKKNLREYIKALEFDENKDTIENKEVFCKKFFPVCKNLFGIDVNSESKRFYDLYEILNCDRNLLKDVISYVTKQDEYRYRTSHIANFLIPPLFNMFKDTPSILGDLLTQFAYNNGRISDMGGDIIQAFENLNPSKIQLLDLKFRTRESITVSDIFAAIDECGSQKKEDVKYNLENEEDFYEQISTRRGGHVLLIKIFDLLNGDKSLLKDFLIKMLNSNKKDMISNFYYDSYSYMPYWYCWYPLAYIYKDSPNDFVEILNNARSVEDRERMYSFSERSRNDYIYKILDLSKISQKNLKILNQRIPRYESEFFEDMVTAQEKILKEVETKVLG